MRQVLPIFKKEFRSYFVSPIAYIVISIFLVVMGSSFFSTFFLFNQASLRNFFDLLPFWFALLIPAVTMRLVSEELNVGTYEILLTMPVSFKEVVLGKFVGALAFVGAMLIPTLAYPVIVSFLGDLDWGPVMGGYLGALLLGASFSAVGLFASSLTRNQIVAFIIGVAICFALYLIDKILIFVPSPIIGVIGYLGADSHFENIAKGILDSRDILYFLSLTFVSLYATHLVMEERS